MAKLPQNHGKPWNDQDLRALKKAADGNTPTRVIALKLDRTPGAIQSKAQDEGISLKPVNQSPYGTQKK